LNIPPDIHIAERSLMVFKVVLLRLNKPATL